MKNKKWGGNVLLPLLMILTIVFVGSGVPAVEPPSQTTAVTESVVTEIERTYRDIVTTSTELLNRGGKDVMPTAAPREATPTPSRRKPSPQPPTNTPTPSPTPLPTPTFTPTPEPTDTPTPTLSPTPIPVVVTTAPQSDNYVIGNVSPGVLDMYLRMVASEAGAKWSYEGSLMIAQVMVNRVKTGYWGDLYGVLTAKNQFTPYATGIWQTNSPTSVQKQASLDALRGKTVFGENVIYFCTIDAYNRSEWFKTLTHVATYDNTMFFSK